MAGTRAGIAACAARCVDVPELEIEDAKGKRFDCRKILVSILVDWARGCGEARSL